MPDARTIATIPARMASGSVGHATTTAANSGSVVFIVPASDRVESASPRDAIPRPVGFAGVVVADSLTASAGFVGVALGVGFRWELLSFLLSSEFERL